MPVARLKDFRFASGVTLAELSLLGVSRIGVIAELGGSLILLAVVFTSGWLWPALLESEKSSLGGSGIFNNRGGDVCPASGKVSVSSIAVSRLEKSGITISSIGVIC